MGKANWRFNPDLIHESCGKFFYVEMPDFVGEAEADSEVDTPELYMNAGARQVDWQETLIEGIRTAMPEDFMHESYHANIWGENLYVVADTDDLIIGITEWNDYMVVAMCVDEDGYENDPAGIDSFFNELGSGMLDYGYTLREYAGPWTSSSPLTKEYFEK